MADQQRFDDDSCFKPPQYISDVDERSSFLTYIDFIDMLLVTLA